MDLITPDFGLVFWQTAILLLVLVILGKYAWGPILSAINQREKDVSMALESAEEAKRMVAQVQSEKDSLVVTANAERDKIIEEALKAKNYILEEARAEAAKATKQAIDQTKELLKAERVAAVATLKNEIAELSLQIAEKVLNYDLQKKQEQERLVQRLVSEANLA